MRRVASLMSQNQSDDGSDDPISLDQDEEQIKNITTASSIDSDQQAVLV